MISLELHKDETGNLPEDITKLYFAGAAEQDNGRYFKAPLPPSSK